MGRAVKNLWNLSQDELMRERLEAEDKQRRDFLSQIDTAYAEGFEKGYKEGFEKGYKEARERRRKEGRRKEREAFVLKLLSEGIKISVITTVTEFSEDEIKALQKSKNFK